MAPPFSFLPSCESSKTMVVYLVRSFGLMPESVSHDWHVQPSCQRPNRGPPKRREFSPGDLAARQNRLSSKLYKHTGAFASRQSSLPTEFPVDFHSGNPGRGRGELPANSRFLTIKPFGMTRLRAGIYFNGFNGAQTRATVWSSIRTRRQFRRMPTTEDKKLRKDLTLEVLALKVPFGCVAIRM